MRKRNSFVMFVYLFALLFVSELASSDIFDEIPHAPEDHFPHHIISHTSSQCQTSLGEPGICIPLEKCPHLRDYLKEQGKDRIDYVIYHYVCRFPPTLHVCCTKLDGRHPFESLRHPKPFGSHFHNLQHLEETHRRISQFFLSAPEFGGGLSFSTQSSNHEIGNVRPGQGGQFEKPNPRPDGQDYYTSGSNFGDGNQGFGFGSSSNQGGLNSETFFGSGRPVNNGFGSQGPLNQGFDRPGHRPGSQGNERPFNSGSHIEQPNNFGQNRPDDYDTNNRPNRRPGSQGSQRPTNFNQENHQSHSESQRPFSSGSNVDHSSSHGGNRPDDYDKNSSRPNRRPSNQGSSGSNDKRPNNQRPGNQGSNKKPNKGASNKRRLLPDESCGSEISDKIIGGENTKLDEFPWMALLHFTTKNGQDRGYGCGGSLISDRYVLTAAHCIKGATLPDSIVVRDVRLGEYDLTKTRDCINQVCSPPPIDAEVEEIIVHPDYRPSDKAQYHDIALIRLRKKVPFSTYVSPICIPGEEQKRKNYSGKQMVVAGWGKTANGANGKSSSVKQKVSLPFVTLENCKPFYDGINIRLRNTQMCAGGERAKDSCQGDSGGPLMSNDVVKGQPKWFATGIVSFGPEDCGVKNVAGVYTRVSEYVDWILDNMKE